MQPENNDKRKIIRISLNESDGLFFLKSSALKKESEAIGAFPGLFDENRKRRKEQTSGTGLL